jgi:histidyl-tRNA synthetase
MEKETVKGFQDFSQDESLKREKIKEIIIEKFRDYGFSPCETPIIENENFVKLTNEDENISDIFKLKDRGKRNLALRYELTFQLKRLAKNKKLPFRRYQIGEVFRDEPISSNRFRQFTQCDVDVVGSTVKDEAEILKLFSEIIKELKIEFIIYINNRKLLNEILDKEGINKKQEVIKEIDKLDKISEAEVKKNLKKYNAQNIFVLFKKPKTFFSRYKAFNQIRELERYCKFFKVKVKFLPNLARGLAYYNGSIFEIKAGKMKEKIGGGGSYFINEVQSTGISFGLERLSNLAKIDAKKVKCLIISIIQDKEAIALAEKFRKKKISCFIMNKISKALDYANSEKISYVVFVGKEELKKKKYKLRDMNSGKEKMLKVERIIKILSK